MPFVINDNSAAAPGTEGSPKGAFSRTRSAGGINGVFEFRVDVFANWG